HHARDVVADFLDVLGRRATTATHEAGPGFDHPSRVARHVLGACEVDLAVSHIAWEPRVGDARDRPVGHFDHLLDGLEYPGRPHRAVHADHVRAPRGELLRERDRKSTRLNSSHGSTSYA